MAEGQCRAVLAFVAAFYYKELFKTLIEVPASSFSFIWSMKYINTSSCPRLRSHPPPPPLLLYNGG